MKNIIILNNTPYQIIRDVWVGKFIDNVNGGKILNELIELWKEYTETDYVYQNNERVLFLKNIEEVEFKKEVSFVDLMNEESINHLF